MKIKVKINYMIADQEKDSIKWVTLKGDSQVKDLLDLLDLKSKSYMIIINGKVVDHNFRLDHDDSVVILPELMGG